MPLPTINIAPAGGIELSQIQTERDPTQSNAGQIQHKRERHIPNMIGLPEKHKNMKKLHE